MEALTAGVCGVVAGRRGRNKIGWTVGGLVFGIFALGLLLLLPRRSSSTVER
jgi:hypothetical protein